MGRANNETKLQVDKKNSGRLPDKNSRQIAGIATKYW